jgi:hypothetical protein
MFGCIRKLGCLAILLVAGAAAFLYRDRIFGKRDTGGARDTAVAGPVWEPLTPDRAERARAGVASLSGTSGKVFVNLTAAEVASFVFITLSRQLPPSADSIEAAAIGDRLYVRASVKLSDLGGASALGPLGGFLNDRERLMFGGNFEIVRPGLSQFRIREVKLRDLAIPPRMIPAMVRKIGKGTRPEGVADDALPLVTPAYIGDVRVAKGKVTLYKSVP